MILVKLLAVRLSDYLEARDERESAFARRAGVPQSTINLICHGGGTTVGTAAKIVRASMQAPAPDGGVVTYEDLIPEESGEGTAA